MFDTKLYTSIKIGSSFLKNPQANPTKVPTKTSIAVVIRAKTNDFCKPFQHIKNKSLPIKSVPNKCSEEGFKLAIAILPV